MNTVIVRRTNTGCVSELRQRNKDFCKIVFESQAIIAKNMIVDQGAIENLRVNENIL